MSSERVVLRVELAADDGRIVTVTTKALKGLKGVEAEARLGDREGPPWIRLVISDWRVTSLPWVLDRVRAASRRFGVDIASCEILGQIPLGALVGVAAHYLKMKEITPEQLILDV